MEFANFVKKNRELNFKFPRTFFVQAQLTCSYVHYLQIESGKKIPTGELAAEILRALKADEKQGLTAWVRDQFSDEKYKVLFRNSLHSINSRNISLSEKTTMSINRMQARLIRENPVYWDLAIYLAIHSHLGPQSAKDIAKAFKAKLEDMEQIIQVTYEYGLIDMDSHNCFFAKEWIFIPDEAEFADIRDKNLERAYQRFTKSSDKKKFRTLHHRTVTPEQKERIVQSFLSLFAGITDIPDDPNGVPFTIAIFTNEREFHL